MIVLAAAVLLPGPSSARGQGFVRWEYQRSLYYPANWDFYSSLLTAGTSDRIGDMKARTYWSYVSDKFRRPVLNRFELHLDNISMLGRRWDLTAGDQRSRENSNFSGATRLRGLSLSGNLSNAVASESFIGRAADQYAAGYAPAFRDNNWFLSQSLRVNVQKGLTLRHWLTLRRDGRQIQSAYGLPSAASLTVLSNSVEAVVLPALKNRSFLSLSRAGYRDAPSKIDANGGTQWEFNSPVYHANLDYQYKGSQYVGPANDGRENGYQLVSVSSSASPRPGLGLNAGYSQRWPQRGSDPFRGVNQSQRWFAGSSYTRAKWPLAAYSMERYTADSRMGTAVYQPRHWRHSLNFSWLWRGYALQAGYQNLRSRGEAFPGVFNLSNQVTLSANRRWNDWQGYLNQQLTKQTYRGQLLWDRSLSADWTWAKVYNSGIKLDWSQSRADGVRWGTESWGWELSQRADWASGWSLATAVRQRFYSSSYLTTSFRSLQWDLKIEKHFSRIRDAVDFGIARGRVFEDNNGNGRRDPGEPGIAKVAVLLDGAKKALTDDDGTYHIGGIAPGRHSLTVDKRMLSAVLDPADKGGRSFTSAGVWGPVVDFPITPLNKIFGIVFADSNHNGIQDPGEPGLPGAYVLMGEQRTFTSSDQDGYFKFFNIRPGRYQVFMDPKFLPDTLQISGPAAFLVEVEDMKKVPLLYFGIAKRVRPVRRIVFPSAAPEPGSAAKPAIKPQRPAPVKPGAKPAPAEIKRLRDLGIKQYASGEYQAALRTWQQLLRLDPNNTDAAKNLQRTKAKLDALKKIQR